MKDYERPCFGIKARQTFKEGYTDVCYGMPFGKSRCFGVPYDETKNFDDVELDCSYLCNEENPGQRFCNK